jgi:pimeloyl-ACP methyl ester carboxylesterase
MSTQCEEQGVVDVRGESLHYTICTIDARSGQQRERDARRGRPRGNIMVLIPGHGQGVRGPKKLLAATARLSRSNIAWCVDPVPAKGGDHVEGEAIARIVSERVAATFPATDPPLTATLVGWSHGASEALRAANHAPELFPQFLGLCPLGLVKKRPLHLIRDFAGEAARILWSSTRHRDWIRLRDALRLGLNATAGLARDLVRTRSVRRLVEDIRWAGRKVSGREFFYPGDVVLLFGREDTVVRWQDAFPECGQPEEIPTHLAECLEAPFPRARRIQVQVLEGTHIAPETDAATFLQAGLGLLDQLDPGDEGKQQAAQA